MTDLNKLSMGEGNTPLIRLYNIEQKVKWMGQMWAKCEYQNPTGSFKDRGSISEIQQALKQNKNGVVCASTGNMAASLSAYATRVKLPCVVFIPEITPQSKMRQAEICGANLVKIDGNYNDCVDKAKFFAEKNNYLLCGDFKTRRVGQRSVGTELAKSEINFDSFIVPFGNGNLGCAISEGFATQNKFPKFIGVKASNPQTVATAIKVKLPLDKNLTKKLNGRIISVSDEEILKAQKLLASTEGIFVETSAAITVAALQKIKLAGNIVLILTGSGLKEEGEIYG